MNYAITCARGRFNDHWIVTRLSDGKVMTSSPRVYECLRWVKAWGDRDLGR